MLGLGFVVVDLGQQFGQVGGGEFTLERLRGLVVSVLERVQAVGDGLDIGEVVGREHFQLDDGEVDLDLVQIGRVHGGVHYDSVGVLLGESVDRGLSAVGVPLYTIQNTR